jgi:hypothetical protein
VTHVIDVTVQQAFAVRLGVRAVPPERDALATCRSAWDASGNAARMVGALGLLVDERWMGRATALVVRMSLERLGFVMEAELDDAFVTLERWARGEPVGGVVRGRALMARAVRDDEPPGARASMVLSVRSAVSVLDGADPALDLSATGAVEVAADAWLSAGLVPHQEVARRLFCDAIRRDISPWDALAADARRLRSRHADDEEPLPF